MTKRTRNIVITILVLACGAGLLIWAALDAQWVQTVSAQEVMDNPAAYKSKSLQIYGRVVSDSIKEDGQTMEFDLYWPKKQEKPIQTLHVKYSGLSKANLAPDADVLIDCKMDGPDRAIASRILTKCPSKYKSRNNEGKKTEGS